MCIHLVMDMTITALFSGAAIALVCYDIRARLKYQSELTDTLTKLNAAHNSINQSFQALSDQVTRVEMSSGLKSKPLSNTR